MRRGLLLILSSPSGAGKSTLARRLMEWDPSLKFSVSATTRSPRPGEEDGREYYFRSRAAFEEMVATGQMLEQSPSHSLRGVSPSEHLLLGRKRKKGWRGRIPLPWK